MGEGERDQPGVLPVRFYVEFYKRSKDFIITLHGAFLRRGKNFYDGKTRRQKADVLQQTRRRCDESVILSSFFFFLLFFCFVFCLCSVSTNGAIVTNVNFDRELALSDSK